jgi:type VI protein secretion system component VasF
MFLRNRTGGRTAAMMNDMRERAADKLADTRDEARLRISHAGQALAGRPAPRNRWTAMSSAAVGVVIGLIGAAIFRRRRSTARHVYTPRTVLENEPLAEDPTMAAARS